MERVPQILRHSTGEQRVAAVAFRRLRQSDSEIVAGREAVEEAVVEVAVAGKRAEAVA